LHFGHDTRFHDILHGDEDIIGWVTVKWCPESLLIEVVANETDTTSKNEETIQCSDFNVFIGFFTSEGAAIAKKVHKADGNATIHVKNELSVFNQYQFF
jgi:hypothetical protein